MSLADHLTGDEPAAHTVAHVPEVRELGRHFDAQLRGAQFLDADPEQRDVVVPALADHRFHDPVAPLVAVRGRVPRPGREQVEPVVDGFVAAFHESVGEQDEELAGLDREGVLVVGRERAHAERESGRTTEVRRFTRTADAQQRRVARHSRHAPRRLSGPPPRTSTWPSRPRGRRGTGSTR